MDLPLVVFWFCLPCCVLCAPAPSNQEDTISFATEFMARFGYLKKEVGQGLVEESLVRVEDAVKQVQRFGGLPETGELDHLTLQLMKSPRCGLPDIVHPSSDVTSLGIRAKRYVLNPSGGWTKRDLTYYISSWNSHLGRETVRKEVQKALTAWAKSGNLHFQELFSDTADIVVKFGKGEHGDGFPFDGPGTVLAHAFPPGGNLGGDIHFDDEETWQLNPSKKGTNSGEDFFSVAVHEVGHSLGLSHSSNKQSVMYPYYKQYNSASFQLDSDDISAMYQLYYKSSQVGYKSGGGSRKQITTTTTTSTKKPTTRAASKTTRSHHPRVSHAHQTHHRHPGQWYPDHRYPDPRDRYPQYPLPGSPQTPESRTRTPNICEGHFDAVSNLRGEIFVFKADNVWRLSSPGRMEPGYPVPIHRMFPQLPEALHKIDAVYQRDINSNLILFAGDEFWVHDGNRMLGGPRPISDYGLPSYVRRVDAVWGRNGKTYIFSEDRYWRFDESSASVDPDYPRSISLFRGVPHDVDSAVTWTDGVTYFFKDNQYWAFDHVMMKTDPSYPKSAAQHWLGCQDGQPSHLLHFNQDHLQDGLQDDFKTVKHKSSSGYTLKNLNTLWIIFAAYFLLENATLF